MTTPKRWFFLLNYVLLNLCLYVFFDIFYYFLTYVALLLDIDGLLFFGLQCRRLHLMGYRAVKQHKVMVSLGLTPPLVVHKNKAQISWLVQFFFSSLIANSCFNLVEFCGK